MTDDPVVIGVLAASPSELPIMRQAGLILEKFDIPHEVRIMDLSFAEYPEIRRWYAGLCALPGWHTKLST